MSSKTFVNNFLILYREFSDDSANKVKLPKDISPDIRDSLFDIIVVREHELKRVLEVIITPFKSVEPPSVTDINNFSEEK